MMQARGNLMPDRRRCREKYVQLHAEIGMIGPHYSKYLPNIEAFA